MQGEWETGRCAIVGDLAQEVDADAVVRVVEAMRADLRAGPSAWENHTLERFLEAFGAVIADLPGSYANRGEPLPPSPTWRMVAQILIAASGYE